MITVEMEKQLEFVKEELEKGSLDNFLKRDIIENLEKTKKATNGISTEEKIKYIAESNLASISYSVLGLNKLEQIEKKLNDNFEKIDESRFSWKAVIIETKWQIVIVSSFIATVIAFHPQIVDLVMKTFVNM